MLYDDETNPQERDGGAQQRASTRLDPRSLAGNWWFTHYTVDTEMGFSSDVMWRLKRIACLTAVALNLGEFHSPEDTREYLKGFCPRWHLVSRGMRLPVCRDISFVS